MRKEGRIQNFVIALFGIAIVAMSIGFAAYATTLTIGGGGNNTSGTNVTLKKAWDVHYDTTTGASETVGQDLGEVTNTTVTNVNFTATLEKPGDTYTFTLPVKNDGTVTAYLDSITMTSLTPAQQAYLEFTVNYDNVTATNQNQTGITGKSLAPNASKTMTVTVKYKDNIAQSDLPESATTINLWAELLFEDSDNS